MIEKVLNELEAVSANAFGKVLKELELNLVLKDVELHIDFLNELYDALVYQETRIFAKFKY